MSDEQRFAIGDAHAGGKIDVVYDHDCVNGHVIRGTMGVIPCPYCLQKDLTRVKEDRDKLSSTLARIRVLTDRE